MVFHMIYYKTIFSTQRAFAALTNEIGVVAWGDSSYGGKVIPAVSTSNQNVHQIIASNPSAFVAIKSCNNETYADENYVCQQCENGKSTNARYSK